MTFQMPPKTLVQTIMLNINMVFFLKINFNILRDKYYVSVYS